MRSFSPFGKKPFVVRSSRLLLPVLPVAAVFALLGGCGSGNGTSSAPPNYIIPSGLLPSASASPTPFPTDFPFPTPSASATPTPTPTPSATAPAPAVTGALRIEEATGTVVTTPFTPSSGTADLPSSFFVVIDPAEFTFESNESATDSLGEAIIGRSLKISLPADAKAGTVLKVGETYSAGAVRTELVFTEKRNRGGITGLPVEYVNVSGASAGTITVVSIVGDVYTLALDAGMTGRFASANGTFRLRGTVSIYAPKPADPFGGSFPITK